MSDGPTNYYVLGVGSASLFVVNNMITQHTFGYLSLSLSAYVCIHQSIHKHNTCMHAGIEARASHRLRETGASRAFRHRAPPVRETDDFKDLEAQLLERMLQRGNQQTCCMTDESRSTCTMDTTRQSQDHQDQLWQASRRSAKPVSRARGLALSAGGCRGGVILYHIIV